MWLASTSHPAKLVANCIKAGMILVLKKGGSTSKLVAKYRPSMPILSVVVPEITTAYFETSCSNAAPARHDLVYCGVLPLLRSAPVRASHAESTEESIQSAVEHVKAKGLCKPGDAVVVLHSANVDMIKICL
ncbi:hypothetical protein C1H46_022009 [Malus baccata]|uniref:Pyruvate kinase C-terminal domain-containing protein n=1 Tax=Malus baccata TaxID=106549 RepID=A0A540M174_MALBA|nr:hypothetical protein C1H46_022009 [Malus baccata]